MVCEAAPQSHSADGLRPHFFMCCRFLPTPDLILLSYPFLPGKCAAGSTFAFASMLAYGGLVTLSHRWRQVSRGLKWFIDNLLAKEVKGRLDFRRCFGGRRMLQIVHFFGGCGSPLQLP